MKSQFIVSVPDEIYSEKLEGFLEHELKMECGSVGCGTTEFYSDKKPKFFKKKIIEDFGKVTYEWIKFGDIPVED